MQVTRFTPGQRFLLLFTVTVIVPGLLLAGLGARTLLQERDQARDQLTERVDRGSRSAGAALSRELQRLQVRAENSPASEDAFRDWPQDASWALIEQDQRRPRVYPPQVIPYELGPSAVVTTSRAELADAAKWEAELNAPELEARYRQLLLNVPSALQPEVKHRLAQTLDKLGRRGEALALWRDVKARGGLIGSQPADLVAEFEIARIQPDAAPGFYAHLVGGRWRLEKIRYLHYSKEMRAALEPNAEESRKLALAAAVESVLAPDGEPVAAGWTVVRGSTGRTVFVVSNDFLAAQVWPTVFQEMDPDLTVTRIAHGNTVLYDSGVGEDRTSRETTSNGWSVKVAPRDAAGFYAAVAWRTNLYLGMLMVVLVLLGSGGYLVTRTVRRELEVARMKAEFVATVSHEFRSPLTGIRQLSEMLVRGRITDQARQHQYHESILRESERLGRLVENVLDFSRMEDGRKPYRFEPLDTSAWLDALAGEFGLDATRHGYRLESNIQPALPPIAADRDALSTAVRNLFENAMKYSPESKVVWLEAQALDSGVQIRVRDRGVGIPTNEQARVFEKFYRGEGSLTQQVKGVGLGLSLVKHIVDAHRGRVGVESREGEGSTFSIHLAAVS